MFISILVSLRILLCENPNNCLVPRCDNQLILKAFAEDYHIAIIGDALFNLKALAVRVENFQSHHIGFMTKIAPGARAPRIITTDQLNGLVVYRPSKIGAPRYRTKLSSFEKTRTTIVSLLGQ
jgi:hypothetical protein